MDVKYSALKLAGLSGALFLMKGSLLIADEQSSLERLLFERGLWMKLPDVAYQHARWEYNFTLKWQVWKYFGMYNRLGFDMSGLRE